MAGVYGGKSFAEFCNMATPLTWNNIPGPQLNSLPQVRFINNKGREYRLPIIGYETNRVKFLNKKTGTVGSVSLENVVYVRIEGKRIKVPQDIEAALSRWQHYYNTYGSAQYQAVQKENLHFEQRIATLEKQLEFEKAEKCSILMRLQQLEAEKCSILMRFQQLEALLQQQQQQIFHLMQSIPPPAIEFEHTDIDDNDSTLQSDDNSSEVVDAAAIDEVENSEEESSADTTNDGDGMEEQLQAFHQLVPDLDELNQIAGLVFSKSDVVRTNYHGNDLYRYKNIPKACDKMFTTKLFWSWHQKNPWSPKYATLQELNDFMALFGTANYEAFYRHITSKRCRWKYHSANDVSDLFDECSSPALRWTY